jgi:integrase
MNKGVMHRRPRGEAEDTRKRTPPVRLGRRILMHLRRWKRMDNGTAEYVCHYDGRPVQKLRRSWRQAVVKAGLEGKVTPHSLRRTRATWLMQAGVPIWEAAGSLGMTTKVLEEIYGMHSPDWQKNASEV